MTFLEGLSVVLNYHAATRRHNKNVNIKTHRDKNTCNFLVCCKGSLQHDSLR